MSDPIPSATADPGAVDQAHPSNAEDRKAAAALSSLNTNEITTEGTPAGAQITGDQEALGKAMSRLEITAGQNSAGKQAAGSIGDQVRKKAVKVAQADITLLVDQLDLSKTKATELLKAHDGDATRAIKAFVAPPVLG
ncbi:uncharacterized protein N7515_006345 [Penicillium bovifimosum]|uniref:Nascent polypeptide-associated complex subunit alpha-like UBA domain-containing protein n=1 Tax=Penicillium bovifimosum TaxID=126998 RepID=A0A9W9GUT0_9EURO|nr:uncharacterized protein N7515_006345 [Penicillium bovifimosum]KAJ5130306.1 hypothetical protein N7515_006345 [Penicillium bovifimosum]